MSIQDEVNISSADTLALDNVRDPGNLGTIIRIADWYGISQIICSKETAGIASIPKWLILLWVPLLGLILLMLI